MSKKLEALKEILKKTDNILQYLGDENDTMVQTEKNTVVDVQLENKKDYLKMATDEQSQNINNNIEHDKVF